jgi:hypothetical protein
LESVQEKAIKNTTGLKGRSYEEKCKEVGLETLRERRRNQDLTLTFKILKGFSGIKSDQLFERLTHTAGTRLATDPWNLKRKNARKDVRLHSFGLRVVEPWNSLPLELKQLDSTQAFKAGLKRLKN